MIVSIFYTIGCQKEVDTVKRQDHYSRSVGNSIRNQNLGFETNEGMTDDANDVYGRDSLLLSFTFTDIFLTTQLVSDKYYSEYKVNERVKSYTTYEQVPCGPNDIGDQIYKDDLGILDIIGKERGG